MRARCPFRRFVLLAALSFLAATAGLRGLRADIQNPGRSSFPGERRTRQSAAPPNAVPQTTAVVEGGTVTITLRAHGHVGETVDFLLRTPPAHGTLDGEPRQLTLNTAQVTYTHRAGDDTGADTFTYAVQTPNSPLSAEATVTVRVQEAPPVLAASPAELDFGAVKAGETTRAELTLTNGGGGVAAGRLDPPAPWAVDGDGAYRLPRGASQTFALVFKPTGERAYAEALHFRNETGGGVRLIGTGLDGPGQGPGGPGGRNGVTVAATTVAAQAGPGSDPGSLLPAAAGAAGSGLAAATTPAPTPARAGATSLEPVLPPGTSLSLLPPAAVAAPGDPDVPGVNSVAIRGRSRSTLDLTWRVPVPPPKSYRVEIRYLSLGPDEQLIVEWRPYALTEFQSAHGFVNARLTGLSAGTQECLRVVAVSEAGRLAAPSPLLVTYTLPPSTWWQPTLLKVLCGLLLVCGGLAVRRRWETQLILRSIDESRRAQAV